jgi:hypothetical protein
MNILVKIYLFKRGSDRSLIASTRYIDDLDIRYARISKDTPHKIMDIVFSLTYFK